MLLFVFCCHGNEKLPFAFRKAEWSSCIVYSDIDLYTGQGKQRLNTDKPLPPCFEVDSVDANEIRLVNWYPRIGSSGLNYTKKGNYWSARSSMRADTANLVVTIISARANLFRSNMLMILHKTNWNQSLFSRTVRKRCTGSILIFRWIRDGDIGSAGKFPADQIREKTVRDYHFENGQLEVIRTTITGLVEPTEKDTIYYKIGAHSLFWWREFGRWKDR